MPLYHFHVQTAELARDEEGMEFPNLTSAQSYAVEGVRSLALDEMRRHHRFSPNHAILITTTAGQLLHTSRYGDCIDVCP